MPKKEGLKKKTLKKKKKSVSKTRKASQNIKIQKALIENFISLQKVMTNLALKFDNLATQISKLLELFEISAKTLAEKNITFDKGKDEKRVVEKLDTLLDQNKIIARGLTLLHEGAGNIPVPQPAPKPIQPMSPVQQRMPVQQMPPIQQRPIQQMPTIERPTAFQSTPIKRTMGNGYQKSEPVKKETQKPKSRFAKKNAKPFQEF